MPHLINKSDILSAIFLRRKNQITYKNRFPDRNTVLPNPRMEEPPDRRRMKRGSIKWTIHPHAPLQRQNRYPIYCSIEIKMIREHIKNRFRQPTRAWLHPRAEAPKMGYIKSKTEIHQYILSPYAPDYFRQKRFPICCHTEINRTNSHNTKEPIPS